MGLITVAGDGVAGSAANDTFFVPSHNSGITFIGRTTNSAPVMTVHNAGANVAVGLGTASPGGRFVAARAITGGTGAVELQGNNATAGIRCLALGYRGPYNGTDLLDSAYAQVEIQGTGYRPLMLNPFGGVVFVGAHSAPAAGQPYPAPDVYANNEPYHHRFVVNQWIGDVARPSTNPDNRTHVMSTFEMNSTIPATGPSGQRHDIGAGRFVARQVGGGAWIRGLEAHVVRTSDATNERTWGLEVGVHTQRRVAETPDNAVGIYVSCWKFDLDSVEKGNTGILIEGNPGWDNGIMYKDETGNTLFRVNDVGEAWFDGYVNAAGFNVVPSSESAKENVEDLPADDALAFLDQLNPVTYTLKKRPGARVMGFIAEEVPAPFTRDRQGVSLMEFIVTLTRVAKVQREEIRQLHARLSAIEQP